MTDTKTIKNNQELEFNSQTYLVHTSNKNSQNNTNSQPLQILQSIPIVPSINHAVAYSYDDVNALSEIYQNREKGFTYARTGNSTTQNVEFKINALESGIGCVSFSTGMAAYDALFFTLLCSGDHVIASKFLFANSISLLKSYAHRFKVELSFVDVTNANEVEQALKYNTKIILVETIANPCTQIPMFAEIGQICKKHNLVYIVDNTITSPVAFKPKDINASLVIHSLTKSVTGHSRALGGAIIDTGLFNWQEYSGIEEVYKKFGQQAYIVQLRKKGLRDKGATLTAQHSDLIAIGLETLNMRVEKANQNANAVANFLSNHNQISQVLHPSLSNHPQHKLANQYFTSGQYGSLVSFTLKDNLKPFEFLANLKLIINCSSIGDNRSLIIHPASTIFAELSEQQRQDMGISYGTFRLSVGIEYVNDLIFDLNQALSS
ncbi:MAG: hypothetical protein RLZZ210_1152 [Pseudomonadota bacterium]|jgi:O-acetylhomoserine (thiol)-lyase